MENNYFCCALCNYKTKRKYDLKRHHNAVHSKNALNKNDKEKVHSNEENDIQIEENDIQNVKKDIQIKENDIQNVKKDIQIEENDIQNVKKDIQIKENIFICKKCNKIYKTKKNFIKHEEKCNGLNILTCPKCMKIFSTYGNKSKHINNNNCKARSIIHAVKPDIMINGNNNTINNITNNIIINNYGSERTDYITFDDIINIFTMSGNYIISKYIELKHFNKDFPENHNIKYEKNNDCYIKKDGVWRIINIDHLTDKLIYNNSKEIHRYYYEKQKEIENKIKNINILSEIYKRFNYLDLQINKEIYNKIKYEVKDLIRTTKLN